MCAQSTEFAQALRDAGLRVTHQRMTVMAILKDSVDHPSADELFERARKVDGAVSFATVYRTLSALEEAGLVRKLTFESDPARFEITPAAEHDHLVDVDTGEMIELASEDINRLRRALVDDLGYEIVAQTTLIRVRKKPAP
ncbi:Fur family transcriptional regulator [Tropicimonas sp. IMCC34043]|uniref:Fur family transcriptional regulator n=1 Tax=Tropicimonas sp. IMCC34043 TaxID=2248760 RepID=UPI000E2269F9|nr:Fur family transcriptional regulator [Tropicimonas sp. IMCC34043]